MVAAAVAFFIEWGVYETVRMAIQGTGSLDFLTIVPYQSVLWPMVGICAVTGLFVGIFGSLMSIRKFLKV